MASVESLLNDILLYTKAQAIPAVRENAKAVITNPGRAAIYAALDGKTSQAEIAKGRGVTPQAVNPVVQTFIKAGLVAPSGEFNAAPRALFTLDELDIPAPPSKKTKVNLPAGATGLAGDEQ